MHKIGREFERNASGGGNAIHAGRTDSAKIDRAGRHGKGGSRRAAKADEQGTNVGPRKRAVQVDGDSFRAALLKTRHQLHDSQRGVEMDVERRVTNHSALRIAQFRAQRHIQGFAAGQLTCERLDCRRFEIDNRRRGQEVKITFGPSEIGSSFIRQGTWRHRL